MALEHFLLSFCLIATLVDQSAQSLQLPTNVIVLSENTDVVSQDTCTESTDVFECETTCPTRVDLPNVFKLPLKGLQDSNDPCVNTSIEDSQLPGDADSANGAISPTTNTDESCVKFPVTSLSAKFSMSFWIKFDCTGSCSILTLTDITYPLLLVTVENSKIKINETILDFGSSYQSQWFLLTLQISTKISVFVNGEKSSTNDIISLPAFTSLSMEIGKANESQQNSLQIADFRIYNDVLTDREIEFLYTGTLNEDVRVLPTCRCPPDHPELNFQAPEREKCTDGSSFVSRFNGSHHFLQFINDDDPQTTWISKKNLVSAVVTVTLGNVFLIDTVKIKFGASNTPTTVVINLQKSGATSSEQEFSSACGQSQDSACQPVQVSDNTLTWNVSMNLDTPSRSEYEEILADKIRLTFSGSSLSYFEVAEVRVLGRCNCYGNADICSVTGDKNAKDYTCTCEPDTKTVGDQCQNCQANFYHDADDFPCSNSCDCDSVGVMDSGHICDQNGGKCICKLNVEGTRCNQCKHLTYNLSSSNAEGCTDCNCNSNGTSHCDHVTGACSCKPHVSELQARCVRCNDYYYGLHLEEGCLPCSCDWAGTARQLQCDDNLKQCQCDITTGQCNCKNHVTGRKCDSCEDGYWQLEEFYMNGCNDCECSEIGSSTSSCDKVTGQCPCHDDITPDKKCTPKTDSVVPNFGPLAGGTRITINGMQVGGNGIQGSVYMVFDGINGHSEKLPGITSNVTNIVVETIPFTTAATDRQVELKVVLSTESKETQLMGLNFHYKDDPIVTACPAVTSFLSGGCRISVEGSNFKSVYDPQILLTAGEMELSESCSHFGGDVIHCTTPNVLNQQNISLSVPYHYGLIFDGFLDYKNLTKMFPQAVITYYDDPKISDMGDVSFRYPFSKTITIKGKGFKTACSGNDFQVLIGGKTCLKDSISDTEIVCRPDVIFPGSGDTEKLEIIIGSRKIHLGKVEFVIFWQSEEFIYICVGVAAFILIIVILFIVCCCCRKGRCKRKSFAKRPTSETELPIIPPQQPKAIIKPSIINQPTDTINNTTFVEKFISKIDPGMHKEVKASIIDRSQIDPGNVCTLKGANIRRIDGQFKSGTSNFLSGQALNIKTLKSSYPIEESSGLYPKWMTSGLADFIRMRDFDHENVMKFYGMAVDDKTFYLLYPAMRNRSLKEVLIDSKKELNMGDLVDICLQAVNGMRYLANQQYVHKDVAARNCMVDSNMNVRISDSSFSWDLFPEEYLYDMERNRWRPVRWMATESLKMGFYDSKSDVWSFGVLMWEVMTRGCLPFQEVDRNEKIPDYVMKGYRLGKPEDLCDMCFDVMLLCWDENSTKRPTFTVLYDTMSKLIATMQAAENQEDANIYQNADPDSMYDNATVANPSGPKLPPRSPVNTQSGVYGNLTIHSYDNPGYNM